MTPEKFGPLMGGLVMATGAKFEEDDFEVWRRFLDDIPDAVLEAAMNRAIRTCKAFPSVALIREIAAEIGHGVPDTQADTFARVKEAMSRFGKCLPCEPRCSNCVEDRARKHIGELGWRAVRGLGGWGSVCNTHTDDMATLRAQFRGAYEAAAAREQRERLIGGPEPTRINNTPVHAMPEPPKALPHFAPPVQPTPEEIERVKTLRIFREADPKPSGEREVDEASRQRQAEWLRRQIEKREE